MTSDTLSRLRASMPTWQTRVERALDHWLPAAALHPAKLHEAMRYAVLGGGKRIRPVLVYATGETLGIAADALDGPACAVELIHAYSLIHDDLPAMDNDDLRRGKPSCHRAFDEATAILAGDGLHALAFHILGHDRATGVNAQARLAMVETLALAAGSRGMVGGQAIDLAAVGRTLDIAELEDMHIHKTGALIRAAVKLAALSVSDLDSRILQQLDHYAKCVGLAFQIRDDILDIEGDATVLGKHRGADLALNKPTYPSLLGLDEAKNRARQLHEESLASLASLDERADPLRGLSHYIVERAH
ncbi:MAG: (2E,6E)-farnesyl diphosphate synthase [Gammaproteobacteria bacterium]|jgi:geranylgeranyl pyrophosphate synthase